MTLYFSHGKSSCDRLGGAFKRKLIHRSLTHPYQHQIRKAKDVFKFCTTAVPSISSLNQRKFC